MEIMSVNGSAGPNSLVSVLLVYGALPRLGVPSKPLTFSILLCAMADRMVTEKISKYIAWRHINATVQIQNGPDTSEIHSALIASHVLVYHSVNDCWEWSYTLLDMKGKACSVLLQPRSGPPKLRNKVVKQFIPTSLLEKLDESPFLIAATYTTMALTTHLDDETEYNIKNNTEDFSNILYFGGTFFHISPIGFSASRIPQSTDDQKFGSISQKKIDVLNELSVFSIKHANDTQGAGVYGAGFVGLIKHEGAPNAFQKSRFVIESFNDRNCFLTHALTIQRASQRPLLSLAVRHNTIRIISNDVLQAYVQSETNLQRACKTIEFT